MDISIGKEKWIKWIEFETTKEELYDIDLLLEPTWTFWSLLEVRCLAECCGIDAFSFWFQNIEEASINFNKSSLITDIQHLQDNIITQPHTILSSSKFNNLFDKFLFIQLLDHVLDSLRLLNK